jgi:hypothetical protein
VDGIGIRAGQGRAHSSMRGASPAPS